VFTGTFGKVSMINTHMTERNLCGICTKNPVAINYVRDGRTYYRKMCGACARKGRKVKPKPPAWYQSGYRKKPHCDMCGFKAEVDEQLLIFHVDGKLDNNDWVNLKTVCLNCRPIVGRKRLPWKPAGIVPDF
jgi:hypothetical protein